MSKTAASALTPDSVPRTKLTILDINELTGDKEEQVKDEFYTRLQDIILDKRSAIPVCKESSVR